MNKRLLQNRFTSLCIDSSMDKCQILQSGVCGRKHLLSTHGTFCKAEAGDVDIRPQRETSTSVPVDLDPSAIPRNGDFVDDVFLRVSQDRLNYWCTHI